VFLSLWRCNRAPPLRDYLIAKPLIRQPRTPALDLGGAMAGLVDAAVDHEDQAIRAVLLAIAIAACSGDSSTTITLRHLDAL
jgi:hypothetical protein